MNADLIGKYATFSQVYIGSNLTSVARLAQESETAWIYTQVGGMDLYVITMGRRV